MESGPGVPGLGPSGFVGSTGRTGFSGSGFSGFTGSVPSVLGVKQSTVRYQKRPSPLQQEQWRQATLFRITRSRRLFFIYLASNIRWYRFQCPC